MAAQYRRIAARRGKKRALVALAHTILVIIYHILTRRQPYQDLGVAYFDQLERQRVEQRLVHRLERLGYTVTLQPPPIQLHWPREQRDFQERIMSPQTSKTLAVPCSASPAEEALARKDSQVVVTVNGAGGAG